MPAEWWIRRGQGNEGPFSRERLEVLAEGGQLASDTEIRLGRTTRWMKAECFSWLKEHFHEESPLPPAQPKRSSPLTFYVVGTATSMGAVVVLLLLFVALAGGPGETQRHQVRINEDRPERALAQQNDVAEMPSNGVAKAARRLERPPDKLASESTEEEVGASVRKGPSKTPHQPGGSPPPGAAIHDVNDEMHIRQAVGLVVCGWKGIDKSGSAFERVWMPIIYSAEEIASLPRETVENLTQYKRKDGKKIYFEPLLGSTGSCFAISPDGYLLTNRHVVDDVQQFVRDRTKVRKVRRRFEYRALEPNVWVILRGKAHEATIIYASARYDLTILKIDRENMPFFKLASADQLSRTTSVWALGFPGASRQALSEEEVEFNQLSWAQATKISGFFKFSDFEYVITNGTVSVVANRQGWGRLIQHNADINSGNSGGPMVTEDAMVWGINTLSVAKAMGGEASGVFYALMMNQVRSEIERYVSRCVWDSH